jgi:hypothetical protein
MVGGQRGEGDTARARLKLGIVIQHYDARNDVRELVDLLASQHEVVLFASESDLRSVHSGCERRAFRQRFSVAHRLWQKCFALLGHVPASRDNFFVTELFKLSSVHGPRRWWNAFRLRLRMMLPSLVSFDFYLDRLTGCDFTPIDDIDRFLVITELTSPAFLSALIAARKPVDAYVYSWDHACKHATFSKRVDRWLVWHEGIVEDLVSLQGLHRESIAVVGATQLASVKEYLYTPSARLRNMPQRYIYYGCGVGHIGMAEQEAKLIAFLAETLHRVDPGMLLVVRPYPMLADTSFFQELRVLGNVRFDEGYRSGRTDRSLTRGSIFQRLNLQEHAVAFVHCGTTMGLEGAYLDSPVIFLALDDYDYGRPPTDALHLGRFIHQYHNDRYMILKGHRNVVQRSADLAEALEEVTRTPQPYLAYNRAIAAQMALRELPQVVQGWFLAMGITDWVRDPHNTTEQGVQRVS